MITWYILTVLIITKFIDIEVLRFLGLCSVFTMLVSVRPSLLYEYNRQTQPTVNWLLLLACTAESAPIVLAATTNFTSCTFGRWKCWDIILKTCTCINFYFSYKEHKNKTTTSVQAKQSLHEALEVYTVLVTSTIEPQSSRVQHGV